MIDRMPEEAKRQKVCFWGWKEAWVDKCTLEVTNEDFYEREEFGDAVPASYLDGDTEGCKLVASVGTYYIDMNS